NSFQAQATLPTGTITIGNVTDADIAPSPACSDVVVNYINWGDGSPNDVASGGTSDPLNGSCNLTGSHTYTTAGAYTVSVQVNDSDEGKGLLSGGTATVLSSDTLTITSAAYEIDPRGTTSHNITAAISPAAALVQVFFTVTGANAQTSPAVL